MKVMEETPCSLWSAMTAERTVTYCLCHAGCRGVSQCCGAQTKDQCLTGEFSLFYEPQKDYWGFLTPMPMPRIQGLAAVYKDSIDYIAGTCGNHQCVSTVDAYDTELNKWTRKKDFPCDQSINPYLKLVLFQNKLRLSELLK